MSEMKEAEASGKFDYNPHSNVKPSSSAGDDSQTNKTTDTKHLLFNSGDHSISPAIIGQENSSRKLSNDTITTKSDDGSPPILPKRKNSLDELDLEIDGMNLDDDLVTSVSDKLKS